MAGSKAQVFHGARAKVYVNGALVGIFSSCSWGYDLSIESAYILGRFSPQETGYTAADLVRIECSGYKVIGKGPHQVVGGQRLVPTLDELLNHEDMEFHIEDRQSTAQDKRITKIVGVRAAGYRGGVSARQLSEISIPFTGLRVADESSGLVNDESNDAATF